MEKYTRVRAKVDLDAVEYNVDRMKDNTEQGVEVVVVIKADGYGHGGLPIARMLSEKEYVWGFAVATLDEAVFLKKRGIYKPVLALGCVFPDQRERLLEYKVRMTVYTVEMAREVSELAVKLEQKAYIHIKLDTGMSRLGFMPDEKSADEIAAIASMPNLVMEGMYTHFSKADETDKTFTEKQLEKYLWMKSALEKRGVSFTYYHCANSAGIIDIPKSNMNLVRCGISTYGLYPSAEVKKENVPLKPAMELLSHVAHVKWVEEGTLISYGGTFVTERKTKIVTVPVGYGDGYPRSLSNKGVVLIHGRRAGILGRVCMDQFMVDATDIDDVKFGDRVTLIGRDGDEELTVEELSNLAERFNYEFVCNLGKRVPHEFIRHGEVIEQRDYFN